MSPRPAASEKARARLLDFWQARAEYGEPVGCVATTFTFDAGFFEEQCLARFVGMQSDPAEDARTYLVEREEKLSQAFACVLVDQSHVAPQRSLRWHLLPVRVPSGIMHAKVSLLAWRERVRVLVGSANLTEPGHRKNYELMIALDFTPEGETPLALLHDILGFLDRLRGLAHGIDAEKGPQPALAGFLRSVKRLVKNWADEAWRRGESRAVLVPVMPGEPSLFVRLAESWSGSPPNAARVLSPFFDDGDAALATLDGLESIMAKRGGREIEFIGPGRELPDGKIEIEVPGALRGPRTETAVHSFAYVPDREERDGREEVRPLHAKSIWLGREGQSLFVVGSSNFTSAGTGTGRSTNVEANLAFVLPDDRDEVARGCYAALPPMEPVDPEEREVSFRVLHEKTPEGSGAAPMPVAFGGATFQPGAGLGALLLEILGEPPPDFTVKSPLGAVLLDRPSWSAAGRPGMVERPWQEIRPPSHLALSWMSSEREALTAIWVVNVSDTAELPPPEELRTLELEDLLEVLTSASPLHETVARIARRKEKNKPGEKVIVDPHAKVDTRNFLLQRMRRLSRALEGLRERLERPVFSVEALRWRLQGPVGAVELARRLAREEREGAAFLIAEVALAVRSAQAQPFGGLEKEAVEREVQAALKLLESLAADQGNLPANLASYVKASFKEVVS